MLVNSIDPLAPYKVSDELILELVNVSALIKIEAGDTAADACWIEILGRRFFSVAAPCQAIPTVF
jgi:hypothetical protein